jgi:hypothetical protein
MIARLNWGGVYTPAFFLLITCALSVLLHTIATWTLPHMYMRLYLQTTSVNESSTTIIQGNFTSDHEIKLHIWKSEVKEDCSRIEDPMSYS